MKKAFRGMLVILAVALFAGCPQETKPDPEPVAFSEAQYERYVEHRVCT